MKKKYENSITIEYATAFKNPAFPTNPLPFANAIFNGVHENGNEWMKTDEAKGILFTLNAMAYGQLFMIDALEEFQRLSKHFKEEGY